MCKTFPFSYTTQSHQRDSSVTIPFPCTQSEHVRPVLTITIAALLARGPPRRDEASKTSPVAEENEAVSSATVTERRRLFHPHIPLQNTVRNPDQNHTKKHRTTPKRSASCPTTPSSPPSATLNTYRKQPPSPPSQPCPPRPSSKPSSQRYR
jgi:hypothetical protein